MRGEEVSMNGIDVSYVQKNIDWQKVKQAGIGFVFARIGYGKELSQKDVMFESHYAGAKEADLLVGGYHYSYAINTEGALKEAENCLAMLEGKKIDFPIAYDMEEAKQFTLSPEELYRIYKTFANKIEAAGYSCILYTNKNWLINKWDKTRLAEEGVLVWMAQYNRTMTYNGKCKIAIWQNSSSGDIEGVSGRIDTNVLLTDIKELVTEKKTGWIQEGKHWWYCHADGSYTKDGWELIEDKWYYFDKDGWMITGWLETKDGWYYLKSDGSMAENEMMVVPSREHGQEVYCFGQDGHMLKSNGRGALV
jgi:GH25 family lysozyme M1 (1,4-beta-N-acetylmuramidase)